GSRAVLFGARPHAQEWADLLGTIHYDVVCSPRGRVTRRFIGDVR
ncbi:alanine racemase C-terminal domain-containing protein, partial [Nocardia abscessus]